VEIRLKFELSLRFQVKRKLERRSSEGAEIHVIFFLGWPGGRLTVKHSSFTVMPVQLPIPPQGATALPAAPQDPPTLTDIANAVVYSRNILVSYCICYLQIGYLFIIYNH
jgi:hypothetical protein